MTIDKRVDIGGYKLYLYCIGHGSPTVVLDTGNGDNSTVWSYVQRQPAAHATVCSYDRAGNGKSDPRPASLQMSGLQVAHELHTLLQAANIPGPYILVGHSLGGIFIRAFAGTYPSDVAGMVLVDASSENQWTDPHNTGASELPDASTTQDQMHALTHGVIKGSLGDLPLVVLTEHGGRPGCQDCIPQPQFWYGLQAELASASSNSVHVMALGSGHYIQIEQPRLVVQAIDEVIDAARAPSHILPVCGPAFELLNGACE